LTEWGVLGQSAVVSLMWELHVIKTDLVRFLYLIHHDQSHDYSGAFA
jgi:hypothetical protein